ncbi:MAG: Ca-activated chloride channel family protein, partial [Kiritimatiellia bacterium]
LEHLTVDNALHAVAAGPSTSLTERVMNSLQAPDEQQKFTARVLEQIHQLDGSHQPPRRRSDYIIHLAAMLVLGLVFVGIIVNVDLISRKGTMGRFEISLGKDLEPGGMDIRIGKTNLVTLGTLPDLEDLKMEDRPEQISGNPLALQNLNDGAPIRLESPLPHPFIPLPGKLPLPPNLTATGPANPGLINTMAQSVSPRLGTAVDSASYASIKRYLNEGTLPPPASVQTEGLINYFNYRYPKTGAEPLGVYLELAESPWAPGRQLLMASVHARELPERESRPAHLVFLVDCSGSMAAMQKLPMFKESLRMLIRDLKPRDRVTIVTAADQALTLCEAVPGGQKARLRKIVEGLEANGDGHAESAFDLAYQAAEKHFLKDGVNRVVLVTDEDYVKHVVDEKYLHALVDAKRLKNIRMSVLRYGPGKAADEEMHQLAARGTGEAIAVDTMNEGYHVLAQHLGQTIQAVVEDVDIQVRFNPALVQAYRLIGYQYGHTNAFARSSLVHGQTFTALYEIVPGQMGTFAEPGKGSLKKSGQRKHVGDLLSVAVSYRLPGSSESSTLRERLEDKELASINQASNRFQWAAAVAAFGEKLRGEELLQPFGYDHIVRLTEYVMGEKPTAEQVEFKDLVLRAAEAH